MTETPVLEWADARPAGRDLMGGFVLILGLANLLTAATMVFAPRVFYEGVGPFGAYNAHFIRDLGTWVAALGIGLALSARRRSLRAPLLLVSAIQGALHLANHIVDISAAHPGWAGPANVGGLLMYELVLLLAYRRARADHPCVCGAAATAWLGGAFGIRSRGASLSQLMSQPDPNQNDTKEEL